MKRIRSLCILGVALVLAVAAGFAAKPTGPIPAVINFNGAQLRNPTGPFPGLHADQPNPPSAATVDFTTPTEDYTDGTQNVAAFFFSGTHNAGMDTTAVASQPTTRYLYVDLSSPISILAPATPPFVASTTSGLVSAHLSQNMLHPDSSGNLVCCDPNGLMNVKPGDPPRYGEMAIFWDDRAGRSLQWRLYWGPPRVGSCLQTAVNSAGNLWTVNTIGYAGAAPPTILPSCASDPNYDVAELAFTPTQGKTTWTTQGYYHVPFLFTIKQK